MASTCSAFSVALSVASQKLMLIYLLSPSAFPLVALRQFKSSCSTLSDICIYSEALCFLRVHHSIHASLHQLLNFKEVKCVCINSGSKDHLSVALSFDQGAPNLCHTWM